MPSRTYPLSPDQFQKFLATIPSEGGVISNEQITPQATHTGTVTDEGCVMNFIYDGTALTVTAVSKTIIFPPWSMIFGLIGQHIAAGA